MPSLLAQNTGPGYQEMNQLKSLVSRAGILSFNTAVLSLTYCYLKLLPLGVSFPLPCEGIKNNTIDRRVIEGRFPILCTIVGYIFEAHAELKLHCKSRFIPSCSPG